MNGTYHNLRPPSTIKTPGPLQNAGNLLGLGLKFCLQSPCPRPINLNTGIKRFERDVRLKHTFALDITPYKKANCTLNLPGNLHADPLVSKGFTQNCHSQLVNKRDYFVNPQ